MFLHVSLIIIIRFDAAQGPARLLSLVLLWRSLGSHRSCFRNADRLQQIRVCDHGSGIDEAHLPHIFDPFYTTRAAGTGLGLAVVAMTVNQHGGDISARNHPTGGAEFLISLPMLAPGE